MADISLDRNSSGPALEPLVSRANQLLRSVNPAEESKKIEKSAKEFESILLGSWLQQAEQSFGSLPGGDDDEDAGKEQFQAMAMQSLGTSMTASGGIGIAKMISTQLHKSEETQPAAETKAHALRLNGK